MTSSGAASPAGSAGITKGGKRWGRGEWSRSPLASLQAQTGISVPASGSRRRSEDRILQNGIKTGRFPPYLSRCGRDFLSEGGHGSVMPNTSACDECHQRGELQSAPPGKSSTPRRTPRTPRFQMIGIFSVPLSVLSGKCFSPALDIGVFWTDRQSEFPT